MVKVEVHWRLSAVDDKEAIQMSEKLANHGMGRAPQVGGEEALSVK